MIIETLSLWQFHAILNSYITCLHIDERKQFMALIIFLGLLLPLFIFSYSIYQHPTSLWTGFWFLAFSGAIAILIILLLEMIYQPIALFFAVILGLLLITLGGFGIYATIIALFWNERILLKHERKSFSNMLPLILATALIGLEGTLFIVKTTISNETILKVFSFINIAFLYFALLFILYAITTILFNLFPLKSKIDYIIVLGAGLNKDKVTPLLASRIEVAVTLYQAQIAKGFHPTIILSGGQGSDELISEAQAMSNYLAEKYPSIQKVYLEDKSTTTRENILFSQTIAQKNDGIRDFANQKVVVASNNYHLLRAGKIAQSLGLKFRGTGSKTRLYYLPTAFIREYIGYLVMTKRTHLITIGIFFILTVVPLLLNLFL